MESPNSTAQKNSLPIFSLFTANAISLVGNMLSAIAIPWFVLQTTGSATQTGVTGFFTVFPVVLAGFFGGTLVDRLGYKRTSIIADIASGLTTALIPLLYFTIGLEFWQLNEPQRDRQSGNSRNVIVNLEMLRIM
jgi:MFS family permease